MQKKFYEILGKLYDRLNQTPLSAWLFSRSVYQDVKILGKEKRHYYVQKLRRVSGLMILAFLIFLFYLMQGFVGGERSVKEITRPEVYEETQNIIVQVGDKNQIYELEVAPVMLTKDQADVLFQELVEKLDTYILGRNVSLEHVTENLYLPEVIPGYPFEIYWESDKEHIVDTWGTVIREGLIEDEVVILTATFQYKEWLWEEQLGVLVCKEVLTEEEKYERGLRIYLTESEKEQRENSTWVLPESFQGEMLQVRAVEKDYSLLIFSGLVLVAAVAIWIGQDYDLHAERQKRKTKFQEEYVSFVGSLSLYISAGLTLQGAMQNCMSDYIKRNPQDHLLKNALQEFQRDLENGYGFKEAMEKFSYKTDDVNYKRLSGMLTQGMVNGSQGLAEVLLGEVEKMREEKRRQAKIKGEQISTALIAPMMLQLGVIIALIMIPAFTNLQI